MGFWNSLAGTVRVRITSASVGKILTDINNTGIGLAHTSRIDDLTVEANVLRRHYKPLKNLVHHRGDKLEVLSRSGIYWTLLSFRKRPVLIAGIMLYAALSLYLPTRIFFVTVTGNETVSAETVISQAESIGIRFGASRSAVRSERVKNALLSAVPQLQWAGVNTYGCVAVISVRERSEVPSKEADSGVRSIVAKCDGIIQNLTVTRGNVLCEVGQAVKAGQVLVSGYTDCGISIKAAAAEAEIYALTVHGLDAASPIMRVFRQTQIKQNTNYSVIIGKKLIKLYKGSGISDAGCVKMYQEHYLTLPGGFQLPIALVAETQIRHTTQAGSLAENAVLGWTAEQSEAYLKGTMLAGKILTAQTSTQVEEDVLLLNGEYACLEMIGQTYNEEIIIGNE